MWEKILIEGLLHRRSHSIPLTNLILSFPTEDSVCPAGWSCRVTQCKCTYFYGSYTGSHDDMVEVGVVSLKKTVNANESQVAFFRIKDLEDYVSEHIEKQLTMKNTWSHPIFENEL